MATNTSDIRIKKLVYLYLVTYASQKSDLALLAINTLCKDCSNRDPMIQGLALRSLTSLNVPALLEYVLKPLETGLAHHSAYVRKIAVLGVLKIYNLDPMFIKDSEIVPKLQKMLQDPACQVISNVIVVLEEILKKEGGIRVTSKYASYLLNNLGKFNQWGQTIVLQLVSKYKPASEEETFDLLDALDTVLQHSNLAVVLATIRIFLNITRGNKDIQGDIISRIEVPLITHMNSPMSQEKTYIVLTHILLLVKGYPGSFTSLYKEFYFRYDDTIAVKQMKLKILREIVTSKSVQELLEETINYVYERNNDVVVSAVTTIGSFALKIEEVCEEVFCIFEELFEMDSRNISEACFQSLVHILQRYPEKFSDPLSYIQKSSGSLRSEASMQGLVWMIGEYGDHLKTSPYIMEQIIEHFGEFRSDGFKSQILSSTLKLFFKRPPEVYEYLGKLFSHAFSSTESTRIKDQAIFYYRLLQKDVMKASVVINSPLHVANIFTEDTDFDVAALLSEFNSLSVLYQKAYATWKISIQDEKKEEEEAYSEDLGGQPEVQDTGPSLIQIGEALSTEEPTTTTKEPVEKKPSDKEDPFDIFNFAGGAEEEPVAEIVPEKPKYSLNPNAKMSKQLFSSCWKKWKIVAAGKIPISDMIDVGGFAKLSEIMKAENVFTFATGKKGDMLKFFFYAQEGDSMFLIQALVGGRTMSVSIKADNADVAEWLLTVMRETLQ